MSSDTKRSDAAVSATPVEGNLVRVHKAKFLSLVGLPANQVAFKVLRSDTTTQGTPAMTNIVRRTRRSDTTPVLQLTFPEGTSEEGVKEALSNFGLSNYRIGNEAGLYTATRADLQSISKDATQQIKLSDAGLIATIARATTVETGNKKCVAVATLEFSPEFFDEASAAAWLAEKCVDGSIEESENSTGSYVVRRSAVPEGEETRQMALDTGVTATIMRSEDSDVPEGFAEVVSETAYGNWGWGQLDFNALMADVEFGEQMREGMDSLDRVLREIVLRSQLPLDVRKALVDNALTQFSGYVSTIMDSLPRQLLVSVVRSATPPKEIPMSEIKTGGTNTEANAATPLTRSDVESIVAEVIARTAQKPAEPTPVAPVETTETPAPATLSRSDVSDIVAQAVAPLTEGLAKLAGVTVARSAEEQLPAIAKKGEVKDVFRGALSSIIGRKS